jgi:hypothetical protein
MPNTHALRGPSADRGEHRSLACARRVRPEWAGHVEVKDDVTLEAIRTAMMVWGAIVALTAWTAEPDPEPATDPAAQIAGAWPGGSDVTVDLLAGSMPAEEPELARAVLTCVLADDDLCAQLVDLALDLDFAWHRAGYAIRIVDGSRAPALADGGTRVTGRARAADRTIDLFIHWGDTVRDVPAAFRGVKRTLAHELGHAMHQTCEASDPLQHWREARSAASVVPTHGHGFEGRSFNSIAEDFADSAMAWLTRGEFRVRSPIEEEAFEPAYPGQTRPPTQVPPELAAEFFFICA